MYKVFSMTAGKRYSWRSYNAVQFLQNSLMEFLSIYEDLGYRIAFLAIRQLGLLVRNAGIAVTTVPKTKKERSKRTYEDPIAAMLSWPFVLCSRLWVDAISSCQNLKPLAYPLYGLICGAIKIKLTAFAYSPFTIHCLQLLCALSEGTSTFVPIGAYALSLGNILINHREKIAQKKTNNAERQTLVKPIDVDIAVRISPQQSDMVQVCDALLNRWIEVMINHLGLLSRHPSFPEASFPIVTSLRKINKPLFRNDSFKKSLTMLIKLCETSSEQIRNKRMSLSLSDLPPGKLLFYKENEISLCQYRATTILNRLSSIRSKVESEVLQSEVPSED